MTFHVKILLTAFTLTCIGTNLAYRYMTTKELDQMIYQRLAHGGGNELGYYNWSEFDKKEQDILNKEWESVNSNERYKEVDGERFYITINYDA